MERLIKDFSKEHSQEERNALAETIRDRRAEARNSAEAVLDLQKELEDISKNVFVRVANFRKINALKEQLGMTEVDSEKSKKEYEEVKGMIVEFYKRQEHVWDNAPFDKNEIRKYFNPEYLKGLNTEEYKKVYKRFGGGLLTHVTRQGIRDHADMGIMGHHGGEGEMHNGFKKAIVNHKLAYNMELRLAQENRKEKIAKYFSFDSRSKEEAISRINIFTDGGSQHFPASFVDFHGPHFAVEKVLEQFYGAETGNEIFFAFPSYMVASNFYHRGDTRKEINTNSQYNDIWVYFKEHDEIDLNSGLVFIPEDTRVDPSNGSSYEVDEDHKAKIDTECMERLMTIVTDTRFTDFSNKAQAILGKCRFTYEQYTTGEMDYYICGDEEGKNVAEQIQGLEEEIRQLFPDISKNELRAIMDYHFLSGLKIYPDQLQREIQGRMRDVRILYIRPKETISSKEYWENYFIANPNTKPNKVIYYSGGDPSHALHQWAGFLSPDREYAAGPDGVVDFDEHRILKPDEALPNDILADATAFREEALQAVEEYYGKSEVE